METKYFADRKKRALKTVGFLTAAGLCVVLAAGGIDVILSDMASDRQKRISRSTVSTVAVATSTKQFAAELLNTSHGDIIVLKTPKAGRLICVVSTVYGVSVEYSCNLTAGAYHEEISILKTRVDRIVPMGSPDYARNLDLFIQQR